MIDRCENERATVFHHYGGRGIRVCDEWRNSFAAFLRDMGARPSKKHSIDRIDNNGNYEPRNCRWATRAEQAVNQRSNRQITYHGETKPLAVWAKELRVNYKAVHGRLRRGWSIEQAFDTPRYQRH